jgi:hypothetical protein
MVMSSNLFRCLRACQLLHFDLAHKVRLVIGAPGIVSMVNLA